MNKKLLICGIVAAGLLLTACVKKESPTEEQAEPQVEVTQTETASEPTATEFVPLEATESPSSAVIIESTPEVAKPVAPAKPAQTETPAPTQPTVTSENTAPYTPKENNTVQSQDDAIADAIAAATPALED